MLDKKLLAVAVASAFILVGCGGSNTDDTPTAPPEEVVPETPDEGDGNDEGEENDEGDESGEEPGTPPDDLPEPETGPIESPEESPGADDGRIIDQERTLETPNVEGEYGGKKYPLTSATYSDYVKTDVKETGTVDYNGYTVERERYEWKRNVRSQTTTLTKKEKQVDYNDDGGGVTWVTIETTYYPVPGAETITEEKEFRDDWVITTDLTSEAKREEKSSEKVQQTPTETFGDEVKIDETNFQVKEMRSSDGKIREYKKYRTYRDKTVDMKETWRTWEEVCDYNNNCVNENEVEHEESAAGYPEVTKSWVGWTEWEHQGSAMGKDPLTIDYQADVGNAMNSWLTGNSNATEYHNSTWQAVNDEHANGNLGAAGSIMIVDSFTAGTGTGVEDTSSRNSGNTSTAVAQEVAPLALMDRHDANDNSAVDGYTGGYNIVLMNVRNSGQVNNLNSQTQDNSVFIFPATGDTCKFGTESGCNTDIVTSINSVVVGALNEEGTGIADNSAGAGAYGSNYLLAPAVKIDGSADVTSAAAFVAGSTALVMEKFEYSAKQAADRLKATAIKDIDGDGIDELESEVGSGKIDLPSAFSPIGGLN